MSAVCPGRRSFPDIRKLRFPSGRSADKFEGISTPSSDNGLVFLQDTLTRLCRLNQNNMWIWEHGMFICSITEARTISDAETMTYTYYQEKVKPKPETEGKKGFVCKICGYVYEGDELPDDFICPLCKHGASDFEPIS